MRRFLTFRVSTLLLSMVTLGVGFAWWHDHAELQHELDEAQLLRQALRERIEPYEFSKNSMLVSPVDRCRQAHLAKMTDEPVSDAGRAFVALAAEVEDLKSNEAILEKLAQAMKHADPGVRFLVIQHLLPKRGVAAIPCLEAALRDPNTAVRWAALDSLEAIALDACESAVKSAGPDQPVYYVPSLPAITSALRMAASGPPSPLTVSALSVLMRFEPPDEIVASLLPMLEEADGPTRLFAAALLQELPTSAGAPAVPRLLEFLEDSDPEVRTEAVAALGNVATGAEVTRHLLRLYKTKDLGLERQVFAETIARIEVRASAPPETADVFPQTSRMPRPPANHPGFRAGPAPPP